MSGAASSSRTFAIVGTGPEGVAAIVNTLLWVSDQFDPESPARIVVFDDRGKERVPPEAPYPLDSEFVGAHAFESDDPPPGFPSFAQYLVDQAQQDPSTAWALTKPTWKHVFDYLEYVLELAVVACGDRVRLESCRTPISRIHETRAGDAATLLLADGTRLEVDRLIRPGPLKHMASPDAARGSGRGA